MSSINGSGHLSEHQLEQRAKSDPLLGRQIGSYQIVRELGRGGMGTVYLAAHPTIGKKIAVKILRKELSQEESVLQRFFYEAKAANDIRHRNVVDVLDIGKTEEGLYYLLMEHLDGVTLHEVIRGQNNFSLERIGNIGLQLCSALSAAHHRGIIHRDLKSENVFLLNTSYQKDFVKLLDFGVARLMESEAESRLTQEGYVVGTPAYMSPEQALGQPADQQSDIYSLGVILYQMVTGSLPFMDSNPVVVATMHVSSPLPPPRERCPSLAPALEAVILKCLEKQPETRYKTMIEVALELSLACRVDPRPHFDLDEQRRLGLLLAAKKENPSVSPTIFDEKTQEYVEQAHAATKTKTLKLPPKMKRLSGFGVAAALCGSILTGVLYWGTSSPALASESVAMVTPPFEAPAPPAPFRGMLAVSEPDKAPTPVQAKSAPPVKKAKSAKKVAPVAAPAPTPAPKSTALPATKLINPFRSKQKPTP